MRGDSICSSGLLETNVHLNVVRRDDSSALALSIFSSNDRILNHIPNLIEYNEHAEICYVRCLYLAFLGGDVNSVAYSGDWSRLARAEGNVVVVCNAESGFEVHRLKGHR